jgi:Tol biopolymer transport system component
MREAPRLALLLAVAACALCFPAAGGASFPGSNGRIVFVSDRDAPGLNGREVYTSNPDGSDPLRLTTNAVADTEPAYSPDGTRIAFTRSSDIWVMSANGSGAVPITGTEGPDSEPAWSPDGTQIVYVSNHSVSGGGTTGPELFVTGAGGPGPQRQLTDTPNNAASRAPAWSPAGDQIAYESNADGSFEVYTIDAAGTASFGTRRSANEVGQNYQNPSWSPDAARIAYERGTGTNVGDTTKEIWTMRADGSDPIRLTSNSVYDVQPAYSPDCTRIAYETTEDGDREIFTRPATLGGTSTNVTNTAAAAADETPDWGSGGPAPALCSASPGAGGPGGPGGPGRGPLTLADLDNPTLGVDVNVQAISGTVLVGIRGAAASAAGPGRASQKGIAFVPLTEARQIPVGSFLDTRRGKVRLESANPAGRRQRGNFFSGLFQVRQSKKRSARGLTDLVLKGSSFRACRAGRSKGASAALSRRRIRQLRANARGRFRTSGRHSSATVRGTAWQMEDRCDGTLTRVKRGRVVVRDFRRRRNITVRAGKSYLAKAPG